MNMMKCKEVILSRLKFYILYFVFSNFETNEKNNLIDNKMYFDMELRDENDNENNNIINSKKIIPTRYTSTSPQSPFLDTSVTFSQCLVDSSDQILQKDTPQINIDLLSFTATSFSASNIFSLSSSSSQQQPTINNHNFNNNNYIHVDEEEEKIHPHQNITSYSDSQEITPKYHHHQNNSFIFIFIFKFKIEFPLHFPIKQQKQQEQKKQQFVSPPPFLNTSEKDKVSSTLFPNIFDSSFSILNVKISEQTKIVEKQQPEKKSRIRPTKILIKSLTPSTISRLNPFERKHYYYHRLCDNLECLEYKFVLFYFILFHFVLFNFILFYLFN
jgi:hypothetical protein